MPSEFVTELVAVGGIAVLLFGSAFVGWRDGTFADPLARRSGLVGGVVALVAMGVNELYELSWPVEAAIFVGAVVAASAAIRYVDPLRAFVDPGSGN